MRLFVLLALSIGLAKPKAVVFSRNPGPGSSTVLAQAHTPVPSITQATLDQYRDQYDQSPVCTKDELTLWHCETNKRVFSLCSSQTATRTTGYLQYRASTAGKVTLTYPAAKVPPLGLFKYDSTSNGNASIEFTNEGYRYSLLDPLRDKSFIVVTAPGASGKKTEIACTGPNQTLQLNYTLRLMHEFGISADD